MQQKEISYYANFLSSGHSFERDEVLLKFQYQMLNTILLVMGLFSLIFAILSSLGVNPIGTIHTTMDYLLFVSFLSTENHTTLQQNTSIYQNNREIRS